MHVAFVCALFTGCCAVSENHQERVKELERKDMEVMVARRALPLTVWRKMVTSTIKDASEDGLLKKLPAGWDKQLEEHLCGTFYQQRVVPHMTSYFSQLEVEELRYLATYG